MYLYPFMKDSRYIKLVEDFKTTLDKIHAQVKNDVKDERIRNEVREAKAEFKAKIDAFYSQKQKEYQKDLERIERAYKNKKQSYENPQAELLSRQDFDMNIQIMSDGKLKSLLKDDAMDLNEYQFNRLQIEFKSRGLKEFDFAMIRAQKNIGKEYLNDPKYNELEEEQRYLYLTRPNNEQSNVWYATNDRPRALSLKELDMVARKNYNPNGLKEIASGIQILKQNETEYRQQRAEYNPIIDTEIDTFVKDAVDNGRKLNLKEYKDADPRAIRGTAEYTLEDEFKYLKERYHDKTNPLYDIANDDYFIYDHMQYLRSKHEERLKQDKDFKQQIEEVAENHKPQAEEVEQ